LAITFLEDGRVALFGDMAREFTSNGLPTWELFTVLEKIRGLQEAEEAVKQLTQGVE
jgi:hypothetical protein